MSLKVVISTYPDQKTSRFVAKETIQQKIAACVQISEKITSLYSWENNFKEDTEYRVIFKTNEKNIEALKAYILKTHPYKIPQVIILDVQQSSLDYEHWINHAVT
jgi:periplasmic divalent cation tolerance protein